MEILYIFIFVMFISMSTKYKVGIDGVILWTKKKPCGWWWALAAILKNTSIFKVTYLQTSDFISDGPYMPQQKFEQDLMTWWHSDYHNCWTVWEKEDRWAAVGRPSWKMDLEENGEVAPYPILNIWPKVVHMPNLVLLPNFAEPKH